jgi:hypothetical protein
MARSIYNRMCTCPHSLFHHLSAADKEAAALGMSSFNPDAAVPGPCGDCSCTKFVDRPAPSAARGISLRPSTSRNDITTRRALLKLEEMMEDEDETWQFAMETINGLHEGITRAGSCTDAQMTAIENIYEGGLRGSGRQRRSRWE